jgi:voltage-gated potassium channel
MYGCRADYSYALKCLLKDHPFKLITLLYFTTASILAYLVYLAERQLLVQSSGQLQAGACTDYQNALWLILITTTTVGYGDYFPQTPMGRTIIVFVAIWGTLIISITVVLVSNTLTMKHSQVRTSKILNKLELRQ